MLRLLCCLGVLLGGLCILAFVLQCLLHLLRLHLLLLEFLDLLLLHTSLPQGFFSVLLSLLLLLRLLSGDLLKLLGDLLQLLRSLAFVLFGHGLGPAGEVLELLLGALIVPSAKGLHEVIRRTMRGGLEPAHGIVHLLSLGLLLPCLAIEFVTGFGEFGGCFALVFGVGQVLFGELREPLRDVHGLVGRAFRRLARLGQRVLRVTVGSRLRGLCRS